VRSAKPHTTARLGLFAVCCLLLAGALAGCATTQDTAAKRQAESKRFLEKREAKRARSKHADGPKSQVGVDLSAHRQEGDRR
jgi:hypothetical protein